MASLSRSFNSTRLGKSVRLSCCAKKDILTRHRPCRADIVKYHDSACDCAATIMDGCDGIFDRDFRAVASN